MVIPNLEALIRVCVCVSVRLCVCVSVSVLCVCCLQATTPSSIHTATSLKHPSDLLEKLQSLAPSHCHVRRVLVLGRRVFIRGRACRRRRCLVCLWLHKASAPFRDDSFPLRVRLRDCKTERGRQNLPRMLLGGVQFHIVHIHSHCDRGTLSAAAGRDVEVLIAIDGPGVDPDVTDREKPLIDPPAIPRALLDLDRRLGRPVERALDVIVLRSLACMRYALLNLPGNFESLPISRRGQA